MSYRIKKVVVLGSGVMGSGIACHLANVGMEVLMLDIVPSDQSDSKDQKIRNSIADSALLKAIKSKPSPVYEKKNADKISTGNFTDNFKDISDADWIIEVVVENLEIKKQIFEVILTELEDNSDVKISSFGTFAVRHKNSRIGRNPKTGLEVPISSRNVVTFNASNILKSKIN